MSQKRVKVQRSKTLVTSMLALSIFTSGILAISSQNRATALSKDGLSAIKDDAQAYRRQAMEYFASGNDSDCLDFYQKAIDQAVKDGGPTSSYVSDLYFEMGCAAKQRAKFSTAEHCFLEALKHRPNSIPARLQLASVYTSEGKRDDAFAQIKAAKVKNPHSPQAQSALVCYIQSMNRPAEAAREAYLIKSMLPGASSTATTATSAPAVSHLTGLTELNAPKVTSDSAAKQAENKVKEVKEQKNAEIKPPSAPAKAVENQMPNSIGSHSVLGLMHGTVNQQPLAAPIVTPVGTPPATAASVKVDDKELELAKAKAQLEMMRKKLEAAEHDKTSKAKHDAHDQSTHGENHKKHHDTAKHTAKSHDQSETDVGNRAAILKTKAVLEKEDTPKKKPGAFTKVQSNVPSDKSSGDSSRSDNSGGENVVPVKTSDLRVAPPDEGVKAPQYRPVSIPSSSSPKKGPRKPGMVPPPPPTPVFPIMQAPPVVTPPKAKPKPKPAPKPVDSQEDTSASSVSASPKSSEDDTKFLLDWGGAGEKHKHSKAKDKD